MDQMSEVDFCADGSLGGAYRWVGIMIEVEPGIFMSAQVRAHVAIMESRTEVEPMDFGQTYLSARPISTTVRIEIEGTLTGQESTPRPDWATEPAGVLDAARRAIGSAEA
jgi:hypothetical protein